MTPQGTGNQTYNVWMKPTGDHLTLFIMVGTEEGFDSVVIQAITDNDILKIFVEDRQVAETDGEVMKYGG